MIIQKTIFTITYRKSSQIINRKFVCRYSIHPKETFLNAWDVSITNLKKDAIPYDIISIEWFQGKDKVCKVDFGTFLKSHYDFEQTITIKTI